MVERSIIRKEVWSYLSQEWRMNICWDRRGVEALESDQKPFAALATSRLRVWMQISIGIWEGDPSGCYLVPFLAFRYVWEMIERWGDLCHWLDWRAELFTCLCAPFFYTILQMRAGPFAFWLDCWTISCPALACVASSFVYVLARLFPFILLYSRKES